MHMIGEDSEADSTECTLGGVGSALGWTSVDVSLWDTYDDTQYGSVHMGQFPQDRENGQNVAFFYFLWSSAVTKRFDFFNFSQLFWTDFARGILKIFSFCS